jgi:hypothetical protein
MLSALPANSGPTANPALRRTGLAPTRRFGLSNDPLLGNPYPRPGRLSRCRRLWPQAYLDQGRPYVTVVDQMDCS